MTNWIKAICYLTKHLSCTIASLINGQNPKAP